MRAFSSPLGSGLVYGQSQERSSFCFLFVDVDLGGVDLGMRLGCGEEKSCGELEMAAHWINYWWMSISSW